MLILEAGEKGQYGFAAPTDAIEVSDEDALITQVFKTAVPGLPGQNGIRQGENAELKNLDIIWSSSYTRAKATAKYIAYENDLPFNLDNNLSERKLGNLKELGEFMKDKSTRDPSQEQLLDRTFRTSDGESAEQTRERINKFFDKILKEYEGKRIAVISHGGSIKFFLLNWCKVNENVKLVYKDDLILNIKSPCLLKLTFRKNELINLEQID